MLRYNSNLKDKARELRKLQDLFRSQGKMFVLRLFREMLQKAEDGARNKIRRWRDGTYRSVSFIDTVGHTEALTRVSLKLRFPRSPALHRRLRAPLFSHS
ncbi:MAG: hydantoinase B/oxoprolinase family protein [Candidatus Tectomicrobia bacterium]|uniref:Hydantoinase B/oxoprolinase family protein n=1 Tax=Tectimicrobiota bacterium TaxID=2528274 RepID=A0A932GNG1_UNCTE|nr:hydantoinase B/oxoprolinase family protein [Candidatus Tectomicrobia bacterium]